MLSPRWPGPLSRTTGCQLYGFYADVTNPDVILSVEVWRDQAALDAHMGHDHTQTFLQTVPDARRGPARDALLQCRPAQEPN